MITNKRRCEIIKACDQRIKSPNVTEYGKAMARIRRKQMIKELAIFGIEVVQMNEELTKIQKEMIDFEEFEKDCLKWEQSIDSPTIKECDEAKLRRCHWRIFKDSIQSLFSSHKYNIEVWKIREAMLLSSIEELQAKLKEAEDDNKLWEERCDKTEAKLEEQEKRIKELIEDSKQMGKTFEKFHKEDEQKLKEQEKKITELCNQIVFQQSKISEQEKEIEEG